MPQEMTVKTTRVSIARQQEGIPTDEDVRSPGAIVGVWADDDQEHQLDSELDPVQVQNKRCN